ncbi:MAG TPA: sigma-70 family RNA polymerase sigma factor [Longimicrobium sp.]|nr:sigma-70 family RNA polymerase sigma factor [Longimicrobium sp.]
MEPRAGAEREQAALVARAQLGDRDALDRLLQGVQQPLYEHLRALLRDPDAAQDALQDALVIVCRKLGWLRDPRWFRAWAYRIATREALRRARRERRWTEAVRGDEWAESLPAPEPEPPAVDPEWLARVPDLLAGLSPASEVVLRMHYLEGFPYAEIAEALEIPLGTVKSRLAYGLAALRRAVQPTAGPPAGS